MANNNATPKPLKFNYDANNPLYTTMLRHTESRHSWDVSFGITDAKGRELGIRITQSEIDHVAVIEPEYEEYVYDNKTVRYMKSYYVSIPAGHYYTVLIQSTRGGKSFGASQTSEYFATNADRAAWIEAQKVSRRKAAEKRAGK